MVHHVITGEKAIETIAEKILSIDLILMDIDLGSGIDGTEAAQEILKSKDIPVIFLSSHTEPEIVEKTEKITSYGYVVKDSGIVVLDASIKMAFKLFDARKKMKKELSNRKILENKIIAEEKRTKTWLQESPICTKIVDRDFNLRFMSDAGFKMLNIDNEREVYGKPYPFSFFPEKFRTEMIEKINESKTSKEIASIEGCAISKDKQDIWLSSTIVPILDINEKIDYFIIFSIDITKQKQSILKLKESEEKYRNIFTNSPLGIFRSTPAGRFLEVNLALADMLGYSGPEDVIDSIYSISEQIYIRSDDRRPIVSKQLQKGGASHHVNHYRRKNGEEFIANLYLTDVRDTNNNILYLEGIVEDITHEQEMKLELSKQKENYYKLFNDYAAVKLIIDPENGAIVDANKSALQFYGYKKDKILKMTIQQINCLPPEEVEAEMQRARKQEKVYFDFKHRLADGNIRDVNVFSNIIVLNNKDYLHSIIFDVTKQKQLENKYTWLSDSDIVKGLDAIKPYSPAYGNVTELNTARLILDNVGIEKLSAMAEDVMALLDTSLAVYEKNGDYAFGVFKSSWCQIMDDASFKLCGTTNAYDALHCGKWLCHENCWNDSAKAAIECGCPTDIQCVGDIHIYAVPIRANNEIIGVVNIGYGNPPQSEDEIRNLSEKFQIDYDYLYEKSKTYQARPNYIIELEKKRCLHMAQLIGEEVENKLKEQQLSESLEKYKALIRNLNEGFLIADENGIITTANEAMAEMLEYRSPDELEGVNMKEIYAFPEEREVIMADLFNKKFYKNYEFTFKTKTGKYLHTSCNIKLQFNEKGEYTGTEGLIRDITDLKKAESEIRQFKEIADYANYGYAIIDLEGNIKYINKYLAEIHEYSQEYLTGRNHSVLHSKENIEIIHEVLSSLIETGSAQNVEIIHRTKSGKEFPMLMSGVLLEDSFTKEKYIGTTALDISDIKEKEAELKEQRNNVQNLIMMLTDGFWVVDKNGCLIMANRTIAEMAGYDSPDEMIGKHMKTFYAEPEKREEMISRLQQKGTLNNYWIKLKRKDGSTFATSSNIRINYDQDGNYESTEALVRDISEIEKLQKELEKQNTILNSIIQIIPGSLNVVDKDFNLILSNKEQHLLNRKNKKINLGLKCYSAYQNQYGPCPWCYMQDVFETGKEYTVITDKEDPRTKITGKLWKIINRPLYDENDTMIGAIEYGSDITDIKNAEDRALQQLHEKEILLREVYHRVKNNISSIQYFLLMQSNETNNIEAKGILKDAISRVQSMCILYERLLLSKDFHEISIKNYIEDLIDSLQNVFSDKKIIIVEKHIKDFHITAKQARTIGIIINELLTNVYKYAFKDSSTGEISISIDKTDNMVTVVIKDNGIGIDERILKNQSPGFGLTIVKMLVEELNGSYTMENDNGTKSVIRFEL